MLPNDVPTGLTFDDVLLVPGPSNVLPTEVDTSTVIAGIPLQIPLLSAAMDRVSEADMAIALGGVGGLAVIHRNFPPATQAEHVARARHAQVAVGAAVGTGPQAIDRAAVLADSGVSAFFVDTAHGHSSRVIASVTSLVDRFDIPVVAGNVATGEAAVALADAGAAAVKVGVGPGSICTTRIVAGVGVPQLSAVGWVARALAGRSVQVIADGGVRTSGDIVKAIAAGAHAVMVGRALAGTDAAPGERVTRDGRVYKRYRGMGSLAAMVAGGKERYGQAAVSQTDKLVPEGVAGDIPAVGPLAPVVDRLVGGLRAGMGYVGAADIGALRAYDRFVRITGAGLTESHVHDLSSTDR